MRKRAGMSSACLFEHEGSDTVYEPVPAVAKGGQLFLGLGKTHDKNFLSILYIAGPRNHVSRHAAEDLRLWRRCRFGSERITTFQHRHRFPPLSKSAMGSFCIATQTDFIAYFLF